MNRPRRTRRDANQAQIKKELEDTVGALVYDLADMGGTVLDLLVCWRGKCIPVEIKRPGCREELTKGEREGIALLERVGVKAIVAESTEEILQAWEDQ